MIRLFRYMKKRDWLFLAIAAGFIVLQVFLELKMPDYTKNLTAVVTSSQTGGSADMGVVWENGLWMLGCALGAMGCSVVSGFCMSYMASDFSASLRETLFSHIMSFSNKEIHQFHTASLITRTTNDVVQIQMALSMGATMVIRAPVMAVWALSKISASDISWTMATLICIVTVLVCVVIVVSLCIPKFKRIQAMTDDLNSAARENVTGVRVIRAFNAEDYQDEKYEAINEKITKTHLFTSRAMAALMPIVNAALNALILAIYWIAALLVNNIAFDPTSATASEDLNARLAVIKDMSAFSQYAVQVVMAFLMIVGIFIFLPRAFVSARRINEVLDTPSTILDGEKDSLEQKEEILRLENVSFAYGKEANNAIEGIDLSITRGETVAFIGATGCGKSTLMNLLLRFYDVTEGRILLEGEDIRNLSLEALRKKFSLAPQKASLFKGSIDANVTFGSEEKDEERIASCLSSACCDFVEELEGKRSFEVAAGGKNLSGGQKQRLSIARSLYKNADIMIFDDTFSALDFKTDREVRSNIAKVAKGKTVLIVAQRIGTIRGADKIVVMDNGRIAGVGTHKELMKDNEVYREIALSQLDKEEL